MDEIVRFCVVFIVHCILCMRRYPSVCLLYSKLDFRRFLYDGASRDDESGVQHNIAQPVMQPCTLTHLNCHDSAGTFYAQSNKDAMRTRSARKSEGNRRAGGIRPPSFWCATLFIVISHINADDRSRALLLMHHRACWFLCL